MNMCLVELASAWPQSEVAQALIPACAISNTCKVPCFMHPPTPVRPLSVALLESISFSLSWKSNHSASPLLSSSQTHRQWKSDCRSSRKRPKPIFQSREKTSSTAIGTTTNNIPLHLIPGTQELRPAIPWRSRIWALRAGHWLSTPNPATTSPHHFNAIPPFPLLLLTPPLEMRCSLLCTNVVAWRSARAEGPPSSPVASPPALTEYT